MSWEAWLTCLTVAVLFIALVRNWAPADYLLVAALTILVGAGELLHSPRLPSATEAVAGLGNAGLVTVAVLFVVVAGLVQTGAMSLVAGSILGRPKTVAAAQARLMGPVILMSAFLNNTPVVAMFLPVVEDFPIAMASAKTLDVNLMPFAVAIAVAASAGFATPFGYQTNLMVYGPGGYRFSDYFRVGLPLDLIFLVVTVLVTPLVWPFR